MRHRAAVLVWVQAALAAVMIFLSDRNPKPVTGLSYTMDTSTVVTAKGPANRAGIRVDDRIVRVNGYVPEAQGYPFFPVRAGDSVLVTLERWGSQQTVSLLTTPADPTPSVVMRVALLLAGIILFLAYRGSGTAPLALIAVAGSTWIFTENGFGVVLRAMPLWLSVPVVVVDACFCAAFLGYALHFALRETRAWWVGYVAALPVFYEVLMNNFARLGGSVGPSKYVLVPGAYWYVALGLLLLTKIIFLIRRSSQSEEPESHPWLEGPSLRLGDHGIADATSDTTFDPVFRRDRRSAVLLHRPYPPHLGRTTNSKFGGLPNLPAQYDWPRTPAGTPLHFLAQIDCAGIAFPTPLPDRGVLFFFGRDDDEQIWNPEDPEENCRVLYAPDAIAATLPREAPEDLPPIGGFYPPPMWWDYVGSGERNTGPNVHVEWPIRPLRIDTWPGVPPGEPDPKMLSFAAYARHVRGLKPDPPGLTGRPKWQEAEARRRRYTEQHEQRRATAFTRATGETPEPDPNEVNRGHRAGQAVFFHADEGPEAYPQYWITIHYAARAALRLPVMMASGPGDRESRNAQVLAAAAEWLRRSNEVGLDEPVSEADRAAFRAWLTSPPAASGDPERSCAGEVVFRSLIPTIRAWAGDPRRAGRLPGQTYAAMRFRFAAISASGVHFSQMLGHAPSAQEPLPPDDPTICLLNLATDPALGWSFGDAGNCTFWITPEDLARRDFAKVWGTIVGH